MAGRWSRRAGAVAITVVVATALGVGAPAQADVRSTGYLAVEDGTRLHYDLRTPAATGRFPTVLIYSGYGDIDPLLVTAPYLARGYATIVVSTRGTGCSEGVWQFLNPHDGPDGRDAIEWIAAQPWSDGNVGMVGASYGGIVQPFVAAARPEHLRAIVPGQPLADPYRDAAYPGGIPNVGVAAFFSSSRSAYNAIGTATPASVASGEDAAICAAAQASRAETALNDPLIDLARHRFHDAELRARTLTPERIARIEVPVLADWTTPDMVVGPRGIEMLRHLEAPYWATFSNGGHVDARHEAKLEQRRLAFLDRYVRGIRNGFEQTPRVELWWDVRTNYEERWRTGHAAWPLPEVEPRRYFLSGGGRLRETAGDGPPDTYVYAGGAGQHAGIGFATNDGWQIPAMAGGHLAYETAPLDADVLVAGAGSVDLWLASTAPDTDLQVTLTAVRPDGQETYIQQGWLRASHRRLDPAQSSETRPVHTHAEADAEPMKPGERVLARVELLPFLHAFRAGHRIRLYVEAPTAVPQLWSFAPLVVPAVNSVAHDEAHPSALVLPVIRGASAQAPPLSCFGAGRACRDVVHGP